MSPEDLAIRRIALTSLLWRLRFHHCAAILIGTEYHSYDKTISLLVILKRLNVMFQHQVSYILTDRGLLRSCPFSNFLEQLRIGSGLMVYSSEALKIRFIREPAKILA